MNPRSKLIALPLLSLILIALSLYFGRDHLARIPRLSFTHGHGSSEPAVAPTASAAANTSRVLSVQDTAMYVDAIMNPNVTRGISRLQCPAPKGMRYEYMKAGNETLPREDKIAYFFALDLTQVLELLPQLIGSVVAAIRFLGPENCALSIVEGNSADGTAEVLEALRPKLDALTTTYYFRSSDINPSKGDRIEKLAELRNMALQPMVSDPLARYTTNTTVIFLNDVAICLEDILELIHQRRFLGADMVCAFDWTYVGPDPTFYDVWVARGMNGDSFFEIPPDGNWDSAWNLFWNNPEAQSRLASHRPFQVFSCWNGVTAFTAEPLIEKEIAFRGPREGECFQGEPQLFCKDMWFHGYRRIATVPSINLEYSVEKGKEIKAAKGYTSNWVEENASTVDEDKISWVLEPPEKVKCMPSNYSDQFFQQWNATLA